MALNLSNAREKANMTNVDSETAQKEKALRKEFMYSIIDVVSSNKKDIEEILSKIGYTDLPLANFKKLALKEYADAFAISFPMFKSTKQVIIHLRCEETETNLVISNIGLSLDKKKIALPSQESEIENLAERTVENLVEYLVDIYKHLDTASMNF